MISATEGVLTTQKLKAMLESRLAPDVTSRVELARAISAVEEHPITTHAVDAWFKSRNPNYPELARESLDPDRKSYVVPKGHWTAILRVFDIGLDDLAPHDLAFRAWCFARAKAARGPHATTATRIHLCSAAGVEQPRVRLAARLREEGFKVTESGQVRAGDTRRELVGLSAEHVVVALLGRTSGAALPAAVLLALHAGQPAIVVAESSRALPTSSAHELVFVPGVADEPASYVADLIAAVRTIVAAQRGRKRARPDPWKQVDPITDKPSIAVLPFGCLTHDEAAISICNWMADELTSMLARIPEFFVISSLSTASFRGTLPDAREIGARLGVRYALFGLATRVGKRLRLSAQLVETKHGNTIWSNRYELSVEDPFALHDDIVRGICAHLEAKVWLEAIRSTPPGGNLTSWRLWQEGWYELFVDAPTPMPQRSLELFEAALQLEPNYAPAHAGIAVALGTGMLWGGVGPEHLESAVRHAKDAYRLLPENPLSLYAMAMLSFIQPTPIPRAIQYLERAVEIEPSNAMYHAILGYLIATVEGQAGVERCEYAMRLAPLDAREPFLCYMLGNAYICTRRYELAIETMQRCRRFSVVDFIWIMLAFSFLQLGDEARAVACLQSIESPRSMRLYAWSIRERMWLQTPMEEKDRFIALFERAGIR